MVADEKLEIILRFYCLPVICGAGFIFNCVGLYILLRKEMRVKTTCIYMAVMAGSDTVLLVTYATEKIVYHWFSDITSRTYCIFVRAGFFCCMHFSVMLLVTMTIEKFISVKYPLEAALWITRRKLVLVIIFLGVFVLTIDGHHAFYVKPMPVLNSTTLHCHYDEDTTYYLFRSTIYRWIDASIYCFIPITLLCLLNGLIVRLILNSKTNQACCTSIVKKRNKMETQITVMLLTTTSIFCLLTMPIAIALIITSLNPRKISPATWAGLILLEITNHSINVLIYSCSSAQFRYHLKTLLCGHC